MNDVPSDGGFDQIVGSPPRIRRQRNEYVDSSGNGNGNGNYNDYNKGRSTIRPSSGSWKSSPLGSPVNNNTSTSDDTVELRRRLETIKEQRRRSRYNNKKSVETNTDVLLLQQNQQQQHEQQQQQQQQQEKKDYDGHCNSSKFDRQNIRTESIDFNIVKKEGTSIKQEHQPFQQLTTDDPAPHPSPLNVSTVSTCRTIDETIDHTIINITTTTGSLQELSSSSSSNSNNKRKSNKNKEATLNLRRLMCTSVFEKNVDTSFAQIKNMGSKSPSSEMAGGTNNHSRVASTISSNKNRLVCSKTIFPGGSRTACSSNKIPEEQQNLEMKNSRFSPSSFAFQVLNDDYEDESIDIRQNNIEELPTFTCAGGNNSVNVKESSSLSSSSSSPASASRARFLQINWRQNQFIGTTTKRATTSSSSLSSQQNQKNMHPRRPRLIEDVVPRDQQAYSEIYSEQEESHSPVTRITGTCRSGSISGSATTASTSYYSRLLGKKNRQRWYLRSTREDYDDRKLLDHSVEKEDDDVGDDMIDHMMHAVLFVEKK